MTTLASRPTPFDDLVHGVTVTPAHHDYIDVHAPFTGAIIGAVPAGRAEDVERAVSLARAAQPAWAAFSFTDRARIFLRFHDLLLDRQDEVLDLIQIESGKARAHAFSTLR